VSNGIDFHEHYGSLNDEELLAIAGDRDSFSDDAGMALDVEMGRRHLSFSKAKIVN
jgi:hypothetical protein